MNHDDQLGMLRSLPKIPVVLTIAGSDSCGGAGIQTDLKTFSRLGCYGMSVITALTAQNTQKVTAVMPIPGEFIKKQIDVVLNDIEVCAVKIGMLHDESVIEAVASSLSKFKIPSLVVDPVMIAKGGSPLLQPSAISCLKDLLLPQATVITPNIPEASHLLDREISSESDFESAALGLLDIGSQAVLLKGGHLVGDSSNDLLAIRLSDSSRKSAWLKAQRIDTQNTHGTGCTLASAIAAFLAHGKSIEDAAKCAKEFLTQSLITGKDFKLGHGHGPAVV